MKVDVPRVIRSVAACFTLGGFIFFSAVNAGPQESDGQDSCLRTVFHGEARRQLTDDERSHVRGLEKRAEKLADGFLRVEQILEEADYVPAEFANRDHAWVAVFADEAYQVGVYRAGEEQLARVALLSEGDSTDLSQRFKRAQRALAATPQDCSRSFGVLDQGLDSERGGELLYAIQLVDRSRELAWGMHYRFEALDGELQRLDRLHVRCSVKSIVPKVDLDSPTWRDRSFAIMESLPGMQWPTEAQLMQLHLYPDLPGSPDVSFWTKERVFDFPNGQTRFPDRYARRTNPCELADS